MAEEVAGTFPPCKLCWGTGWVANVDPRRGTYTRARCACPAGPHATPDPLMTMVVRGGGDSRYYRLLGYF